MLNRNILRALLILSYILLIASILFGISSLYSYLNTGADRGKMLHLAIKKTDPYLPKLIWSPLNNEGRKINEQTLNAIENDYLDAWYIKNVAYKTNLINGIDDYYTESSRENIYDFIALNKAQKIHIESTSIEHHPSLDFLSEDGQLAVITDKNVKEYKQVYKNNTLILDTTELASYKSILLLEDGFWRSRHLIKEQATNSKYINTNIDISKTRNIKGINYYPQASPWDMYDDSFNTNTISKDFEIIKKSGLNTIRIFVPYNDFGKANVDSKKIKKLIQTLDLAASKKLQVIVTLFDFYGDYSVLDWTLNHRHAETIVSALKDHKALFAWDIKNEPNLDFESRGKTNVIAWLEALIDVIKAIDSKTPITIGWSNTQSADILKNKVDFISFHYYESLDKLEQEYNQIKIKVPNKPIVLGEFGLSSYNGIWNLYTGSETEQTEYHKKIQKIFSKNNIPFISWTLYDFKNIPKEVVGRLPWRKQAQKHFGFIDQKGETKPAFKYISRP